MAEDDYSLTVREAAKNFISTLQQINGKTKDECGRPGGSDLRSVQGTFRRDYEIQEYTNPEKTYHAYKVSDLEEIFSSSLPMDLFCSLYEAEGNDKIIVSEPEYLALFGSLMTDENLPLWKEYVKTIFYDTCSDWSDMESQNALGTYLQIQAGTVAANHRRRFHFRWYKRY